VHEYIILGQSRGSGREQVKVRGEQTSGFLIPTMSVCTCTCTAVALCSIYSTTTKKKPQAKKKATGDHDPDNIDTLQQREYPEVPLETTVPAYSLTAPPSAAHAPHHTKITPDMAHKYTPTTYNQVLKNLYRDNWLEAITAELDTLNRANALKHQIQYSTVLYCISGRVFKHIQLSTVSMRTLNSISEFSNCIG
jgi:hypothetical protein